MNKIFQSSILIFSIALLFSCKGNSEKKDISKTDNDISPGLIYVKTENIDEAVKELKEFIELDDSFRVSSEINHSKNAKKVGLELPQNEVYFIDDPRYTIPLIEENSLMALEFPLRIGFYKIGDENFGVARSQDYFQKRYNLTNSAALRSIGATSKRFLKQSTDSEFTQTSPIDSLDTNGIQSLKSSKSFEETVASIQKLLDENDSLIVFESKDFTKEASDIGFEINPMHLFVFGNPEKGTPLMQKNQNFSIDLPLKVLVEENKDQVVEVYFQDLSFTAKLHSEKFEDSLPQNITNSLKQMLMKAVSESSSK